MPIVYRVLHEVEIEALGDHRDQALAAELRELGYNAGSSLATAIELAIGTENGIVEVDEAATLEALARALDHRRNAASTEFETPDEQRTFPAAHTKLRDHLIRRLGFKPITYRLQGLDNPPPQFVSYTGTYADNDRLVTGGGRAWRAARVVYDRDHQVGEIDVEPW